MPVDSIRGNPFREGTPTLDKAGIPASRLTTNPFPPIAWQWIGLPDALQTIAGLKGLSLRRRVRGGFSPHFPCSRLKQTRTPNRYAVRGTILMR